MPGHIIQHSTVSCRRIQLPHHHRPMENKPERGKIMKSQEIESLENPFTKLAPELVAHILSYLYSIPSRMSASRVCHLWRELVNWKEIKQLSLDFEQLHINKVPLDLAKWSTALESLLPKVKLTSLEVQLPSQALSKRSEPGLYLTWPLSLLDCGVAVNELNASLSSITHFCISGHPTNPQFEFGCHLLSLCPSVTHLSIKLHHHNFDQRLLQSSLTNKPLQQLNIQLSHGTDNYSAARLAQLCQVLAPATLKSLTLNIGAEDSKDHQYIFAFVQFFRALQSDAGCLSELEGLTVAAPWLGFSQMDLVALMAEVEHIPNMVNDVLPKLQTLEFTIPGCHPKDWELMQSMLVNLSRTFNRPLDVSLSTSHCVVFELYVDLKFQHPLEVQLAEDGFKCTGKDAPIEFEFRRLAAVCDCDMCRLEYGLVKQRIIDRLNGGAAVDKIRLFDCQLEQLKVDLSELFPGFEITDTQTGDAFSVGVVGHNALGVGDVCAGCAMLPRLE